MDISIIKKKIQDYQHLVVDARETFVKENGWAEDDARATIFNKMSNVLIVAMLSFVFLEKNLIKRDWWEKNATLPFNDKALKETLNQFEMSIRVALIQNMMYAIESSFKIFVRKIDPLACKNGNAEFQSIYRFLLKYLKLEKHLNVLDLWRNIRNVMHNNGLFMPVNGADQIVLFDGKEYEFKFGKHLDFVDTEFIVRVLSGLIVAVVEIVNDPEIKKIVAVSEIS